MSRAIRANDEGEHVRAHQRHLNDRLRAHGNRPITVSGKCDKKTIEQTAFAAWFLGALLKTVETVQAGTIPAGVQGIVGDPESREPAQRRRARERRDKPVPSFASPSFRIIPCGEWGAVAPTGQIRRVGRPNKIIFHATDGHAPPGGTVKEAMAYARSIQRDHMNRNPPFIDSGHNFLVTRSAHVLEGRHGSLAAINAGRMVGSAHCIPENNQPGIEHEHKGGESMTAIQREASLFLHELICRKTGIKPSAIRPHRQFDSTACPAALGGGLAQFRKDLAERLA